MSDCSENEDGWCRASFIFEYSEDIKAFTTFIGEALMNNSAKQIEFQFTKEYLLLGVCPSNKRFVICCKHQ